MDREAIIKAAMVGFAASREGFNGECAFEDLDPDEAEIKLSLEKEARQTDGIVRVAVERALKVAGLLA